MKVIGLTGGIGTGKSTVARILERLGAAIVDMDSLGHEAIRKGSQAWHEIVGEFGEAILNTDGEIDRTRLGNIVFKDKRALAKLNGIVHPEIDRLLRSRLEEYRRKGVKVVFLEAAAMIEAGRTGQANEIWVTTAPEAVILKRLAERSGYSPEEARSRILSQLPDAERTRHASVIIDTDCSLDELRQRVEREWQKLLTRLEDG